MLLLSEKACPSFVLIPVLPCRSLMVTVMMVVVDKRMDEMDKRLMTETAPAGQINQVELGASDVLLAKGVGVDHLSPAFNQQRRNTSSFHPNESKFEDECDRVKV